MVEQGRKGWRSLRYLVGLFAFAGLAWLPSQTNATIRVGNSEIQLVYEMQHTFQFNGSPADAFEWVQWRNELRLEYQYEDLVEQGKLFNQFQIPFIRDADFSMIYRGRMDPVYTLRDKYRRVYNEDQRDHFMFPENDIREINLDLDFGEVFGHKLSARIGKQQIVWGESDLFRSIDIVNPLRVDQNGFVGEAFEDFRTPIWAAKFLYDIGNVGTIFSNIGIEAFYTPRWRPFTNHLILEGGWDLQYQDNGRSFERTQSLTSPNVTTFRHRLAPFKPWGRVRNPWSLFRVGPNAAREAPDYGCLASPCDEGSRANFIYNIDGSRHQIRGTKWENSMVGTRILGKAFDNFDFTLNYLFKRADPAAGLEVASLFDPNQPGTGAIPADRIFDGSDPAQLAAGLDRCLRQRKGAFLLNTDLYGYNTDGNPNNDRAATGCLETFHFYPWTHIAGFTTTYNDFDYTGAVFRLEQSWSTNEPRNFNFDAWGGRDAAHANGFHTEGSVGKRQPCPPGGTFCPGKRAFREKAKSGTAVWRSMVGFDLLRSWNFLPGSFGVDQWFLTGQHLMTYENNNRPTNLNAFTNAPRDRHQRWEQLFTLSGSGFFIKGKFEPLWAYAYSPNAKQHLILAQFFWHGFYFRNLDLFAGMALYPGSAFRTDASFLNYYADRDTFWIRLQYFIL
jgi:hypothetical protein